MTDSDEERMRKEAKREGLCLSQRSFNLGAHGTALAACGLKANHLDWERADEDQYSPDHVARTTMDDGAVVMYVWSDG